MSKRKYVQVVALFVVCGCWVDSSSARSQEIQPQAAARAAVRLAAVQEDAGRALQERLARRAEQKRKRLQAQMDLRIKDITQVCELSAVQQKKLRVASKGAIAQHFKQFESDQGRAIGNFVIRAGGAVIEAEAAEAGGDGQNNNEDQGAQDVQVGEAAVAVPQVFIRERGVGGNVQAVLQQSIWKKTLDKTLTDDQKAAYATAQNQRAEFRKQASIRYLVSQLDRDLLLTAQQRSGMEALLNRELKLSDRHRWHPDPAHEMMAQARRISQEQLAGLLSTEQVGLWKRAIRGGDTIQGVFNLDPDVVPEVIEMVVEDLQGERADQGGEIEGSQ